MTEMNRIVLLYLACILIFLFLLAIEIKIAYHAGENVMQYFVNMGVSKGGV